MVSTAIESSHPQLAGRLHQLIELGKNVVARGLVVGSGGNLSTLDPDGNSFYITGTGTKLDELTFESFVHMDLDGEVISGSMAPSSEYRVHLESYLVRKDISTCIHLHPQASVLLAACNEDIKFLTTDHVYYIRKVVRVPWMRPGTQEIAEATAAIIGETNVVILENHGCLVVADSIPLAHTRVLNLEEAAELTLRTLQLKIDPTPVPGAYREFLRENGL